mmetsp:Transcript_7120/g.17867  ORF Transcript_7120/g.17867 Transcript_7120/m.17867 type:complete len:230 (-) Transcript_7120:1572-2261(-)
MVVLLVLVLLASKRCVAFFLLPYRTVFYHSSTGSTVLVLLSVLLFVPSFAHSHVERTSGVNMPNNLHQAATFGREATRASSACRTFSKSSASSFEGAVPLTKDFPWRVSSSLSRASSPVMSAPSDREDINAMREKSESDLGALAAISAICSSEGFMAGNNRTSLMLFVLERNMVRRSMPRPNPPVGGNPCSRAVTKESSSTMASSSPALPALACSKKSSRWTTGLFNSV